MTNKITVDIDTMNSANLGIKGINVKIRTVQQQLMQSMLFPMQSLRFLPRDPHSVLYRTD